MTSGSMFIKLLSLYDLMHGSNIHTHIWFSQLFMFTDCIYVNLVCI